MTRINVGIDVKQLTDEHLLAEHREIKRLPAYLNKAIASGSIKRIPQKFTLGSGHVLFFLDKLLYAFDRYIDIHSECINRGFQVEDYSDNFLGLPDKYINNYKPTEEDIQLIKERINTRITESSKQAWHYYGQVITKEEALLL